MPRRHRATQASLKGSYHILAHRCCGISLEVKSTTTAFLTGEELTREILNVANKNSALRFMSTKV